MVAIRKAWIVGAALVALTAVPGCTAPGGQAPQRPASAIPAASSGSRHSPGLPAAALPSAADMGRGYLISSDQPAVAADLGSSVSCPASAAVSPTAVAVHRGGTTRSFKAPRGHVDAVTVHEYADAGAGRAWHAVRDRIHRCAKVTLRLDDGKPGFQRWSELATDFAGDHSVVARSEFSESGRVTNVDYFVYVQQDSLVLEAWLSDQRWTAVRLRALAERLAERMCGVTSNC